MSDELESELLSHFNEIEAIFNGKSVAPTGIVAALKSMFAPSPSPLETIHTHLDWIKDVLNASPTHLCPKYAERYNFYAAIFSRNYSNNHELAYMCICNAIDINPHPAYLELRDSILKDLPGYEKPKEGSLLRATINPIAPTVLHITVQLSDDARRTLDKGKLWDYSLGEIHNWLYNYEVQKYNEAWLRYDIYEKNKNEHTRYRMEKPTLPQPNTTRPVLIQELCNPKGYKCYFDTASDAKAGAEQLRAMLQRLKSFIEDNQTPQQKQTFDL